MQESYFVLGVAGRCGFIYWVWSVGVAFVPEPVLKKLEPMTSFLFKTLFFAELATFNMTVLALTLYLIPGKK